LPGSLKIVDNFFSDFSRSFFFPFDVLLLIKQRVPETLTPDLVVLGKIQMMF
jgi:hypothetical protein